MKPIGNKEFLKCAIADADIRVDAWLAVALCAVLLAAVLIGVVVVGGQ